MTFGKLEKINNRILFSGKTMWDIKKVSEQNSLPKDM